MGQDCSGLREPPARCQPASTSKGATGVIEAVKGDAMLHTLHKLVPAAQSQKMVKAAVQVAVAAAFKTMPPAASSTKGLPGVQ